MDKATEISSEGHSPLKVAVVCKSDTTGGAAVVSFRLMNALRNKGVDARMVVVEKCSDSPYVIQSSAPTRAKIPFLAERLKIFIANGFQRHSLFQIDTASDGLPVHKIPFVKEADVICLNWVNQGMLSFRGLEKLGKLHKPIVWTMHDMWNMTGICHHAGVCGHYMKPAGECGDCPLLGKRGCADDLSHNIFLRKQDLYHRMPITFVAVSNWLAERARSSTLLKDASLHVIPNPFPREYFEASESSKTTGKIRIVFGAARLDDPIKDFPALIEALDIIREIAPDLSDKMELVTFGNIKDPTLIDNIHIPVSHQGKVSPRNIRGIYESAHIVVSTSSHETLPGTLIEGQAWGCIPVAFRRGGQSDIIDHKVTGYLADWDSNLHIRSRSIAEGILWAADILEKEEGSTIRELMLKSVCDRFSEEAVAERYIDLFGLVRRSQ